MLYLFKQSGQTSAMQSPGLSAETNLYRISRIGGIGDRNRCTFSKPSKVRDIHPFEYKEVRARAEALFSQALLLR